ncbi:hypothetical protein D3C78_987500 [compost metagenome]
MRLFGARGLQVDHAADAGVGAGNIQRAAGFQRHLVTGVTQALQQRQGVGLGQWLATGDADVARLEAGDLLKDRIEGADGTATEGIGTVTVLAAQGATGEAHEYRGQPSRSRFTLQGVKDFGDA